MDILQILSNMSGVFANVGTVVLGSLIGILFKKAIPKSLADILMQGLGLCTLFIGVQGALKGQNTLIMILSVVLGTVIGTILKLDDRLNNLGNKIESKFKKQDGGNTSLAQGFVTSSLVFCVGAMTIVGSLNAGLYGDNTMLYTKAMLDLVSSCVFASTLGFGVTLSAIFVFVFQGALVLLAGVAAPIFSDVLIAEMTCAGSILIMGIGLNLIGITKIKVMNMLPAMFVPIVLCLFM